MRKVPRYKRKNKRNNNYFFKINNIENTLEEIKKDVQKINASKQTKFNIDWSSTISLILSIVALIISVKALNYDNLSIILGATEPILNIDLDEYRNSITISNKTHQVFDIRHVTFGKVRPFALCNISDDVPENQLYRAIDIPFLETHLRAY